MLLHFHFCYNFNLTNDFILVSNTSIIVLAYLFIVDVFTPFSRFFRILLPSIYLELIKLCTFCRKCTDFNFYFHDISVLKIVTLITHGMRYMHTNNY